MASILFLTPRFPWPLIGGDRVKSYFLLKHLAKSHRVHLITFNHGGPASDVQVQALRDIGVSADVVPLKPFVAGVASLRTIWTDLPLEIAFYTRPEFQRAVDSYLENNNVDIALSFFMRTTECIRNRPGLPRILVAEDCRMEYQARSAASSRSPFQRAVRHWERWKLEKYEPRVVEDFNRTTFVSEQDVEAMRGLNPSLDYDVVTNGVDLERFSFVDDAEQRSGILFTGKLSLQANYLMATTILRQILPAVRTRVPNVHLTIAGATPVPALRAQIGQGVTLKVDVPEIVPYLHSHAVFVHPHKGGSGIQNKLLEAMAAGCAVVTTQSGLQGIEAKHGEHCLIGSTPGEMADHVVQLLQNPAERQRLARNARRLMEETHSWDIVHNQIDAVIDEVLSAEHTA